MDDENTEIPQQDNEQPISNPTVEQGKNELKNAKENSKTYQKVKAALKQFIITHIPVIVLAFVILLIVITFIGLLQALLSMPGLILGILKEYGEDILAWIGGWLTGDNISAHISKQDEIDLAQYIQDMGYDIVGYGFADVEYERDSEETGETGFENGTIKELYDIDDKNYIRHYLVQNEAIYSLATWSWSGFFQSLTSNSNAESYGKGMINLLKDGKEYSDGDVGIDRKRKALRIATSENEKMIAHHSYFYFQMDNWSSLYGKPLELFLALHIATMMPDLTYDLATDECFNTKVNIELQEVKINYKVVISDGGTTVDQTGILKAYLKSKWGFTDEELSNLTSSQVEDLYNEIEDYVNSSEYSRNKGFSLKEMMERSGITTPGDSTPSQTTDKWQYTETSYINNPISTINSSDVSIKTVARTTTSSADRSPSNARTQTETTEESTEESTDTENNNSDVKKEIPDDERESYLEDYDVEQLDALVKQMQTVDERYIKVLWPRIDTVTKHWFYNTVKFPYEQASVAKKKIHFSADDTTSPLYGAEGIFLDAEIRGLNNEGVYYQTGEPTATGPNDAIVALFKGGKGTLKINEEESENYDFPGEYYRYDGSRNTAKDIRNALANGSPYQFMGKTYYPEKVNVEKEPVVFYDTNNRNSYKNAYSAFAILENSKTLVAEAAYRNLKELLIALEYFTEDELKEPVEQVLEWFMPDNSEEKDNVYKKPNEYGLFVKDSMGKEIIAPGDGEVIAVSGDSITIRFGKLNPEKLEQLQEMFEEKLYNIKETDIVDMEMVISGINPTVSKGSKITMGDKIGTASKDEVQVYMKYSDGSIVDDVITYMDQKLEEPPKIDEIPKGESR